MSYQNILTNAEKQARSVSFGSEQAERPHTLQRELRDLRSDVESAFSALEQGTSFPLITTYDLAVDHSSNDTDGVNKGFMGANLLAGRSLATLTIGDLTFSGLKGAASNNVTVTIAAPDGVLGVSVVGNDITISPAAGGSTYADIATEINDTPAAKKLITVTDDGAGNSADAAVAKQSLSGGTGNGVTLLAYDDSNTKTDITEAITKLTDTQVVVADDTVVGSVSSSGSIVGFVFTSHTARSQVIHVVAN